MEENNLSNNTTKYGAYASRCNFRIKKIEDFLNDEIYNFEDDVQDIKILSIEDLIYSIGSGRQFDHENIAIIYSGPTFTEVELLLSYLSELKKDPEKEASEEEIPLDFSGFYSQKDILRLQKAIGTSLVEIVDQYDKFYNLHNEIKNNFIKIINSKNLNDNGSLDFLVKDLNSDSSTHTQNRVVFSSLMSLGSAIRIMRLNRDVSFPISNSNLTVILAPEQDRLYSEIKRSSARIKNANISNSYNDHLTKINLNPNEFLFSLKKIADKTKGFLFSDSRRDYFNKTFKSNSLEKYIDLKKYFSQTKYENVYEFGDIEKCLEFPFFIDQKINYIHDFISKGFSSVSFEPNLSEIEVIKEKILDIEKTPKYLDQYSEGVTFKISSIFSDLDRDQNVNSVVDSLIREVIAANINIVEGSHVTFESRHSYGGLNMLALSLFPYFNNIYKRSFLKLYSSIEEEIDSLIASRNSNIPDSYKNIRFRKEDFLNYVDRSIAIRAPEFSYNDVGKFFEKNSFSNMFKYFYTINKFIESSDFENHVPSSSSNALMLSASYLVKYNSNIIKDEIKKLVIGQIKDPSIYKTINLNQDDVFSVVRNVADQNSDEPNICIPAGQDRGRITRDLNKCFEEFIIEAKDKFPLFTEELFGYSLFYSMPDTVFINPSEAIHAFSKMYPEEYTEAYVSKTISSNESFYRQYKNSLNSERIKFYGQTGFRNLRNVHRKNLTSSICLHDSEKNKNFILKNLKNKPDEDFNYEQTLEYIITALSIGIGSYLNLKQPSINSVDFVNSVISRKMYEVFDWDEDSVSDLKEGTRSLSNKFSKIQHGFSEYEFNDFAEKSIDERVSSNLNSRVKLAISAKDFEEYLRSGEIDFSGSIPGEAKKFYLQDNFEEKNSSKLPFTLHENFLKSMLKKSKSENIPYLEEQVYKDSLKRKIYTEKSSTFEFEDNEIFKESFGRFVFSLEEPYKSLLVTRIQSFNSALSDIFKTFILAEESFLAEKDDTKRKALHEYIKNSQYKSLAISLTDTSKFYHKERISLSRTLLKTFASNESRFSVLCLLFAGPKDSVFSSSQGIAMYMSKICKICDISNPSSIEYDKFDSWNFYIQKKMMSMLLDSDKSISKKLDLMNSIYDIYHNYIPEDVARDSGILDIEFEGKEKLLNEKRKRGYADSESILNKEIFSNIDKDMMKKAIKCFFLQKKVGFRNFISHYFSEDIEKKEKDSLNSIVSEDKIFKAINLGGRFKEYDEEKEAFLSLCRQTKEISGFKIQGFLDKKLQPFYSIDSFLNALSINFKDLKSKENTHAMISIRSINFICSYLEQSSNFSKYYSRAIPKMERMYDADFSFKLNEGPMKNYRFRVLRHGDPYHFQVGIDTDCCQAVGLAGAAAAIDSFVNRYAGVILLEGSNSSIGHDYKLLSQSYFHIVEKDDDEDHISDNYEDPEEEDEGLFILDNIEASVLGLDIDPKIIASCYYKLYQHLSDSGFKKVLCGKGYSDLDTNLFASSSIGGDPRIFEYQDKYTDFDSQDHMDISKPNFGIKKEEGDLEENFDLNVEETYSEDNIFNSDDIFEKSENLKSIKRIDRRLLELKERLADCNNKKSNFYKSVKRKSSEIMLNYKSVISFKIFEFNKKIKILEAEKNALLKFNKEISLVERELGIKNLKVPKVINDDIFEKLFKNVFSEINRINGENIYIEEELSVDMDELSSFKDSEVTFKSKGVVDSVKFEDIDIFSGEIMETYRAKRFIGKNRLKVYNLQDRIFEHESSIYANKMCVMYLSRVLFRYKDIFSGKGFDDFIKNISNNIDHLEEEISNATKEQDRWKDILDNLISEYSKSFKYSLTFANAIYENKKRLESDPRREKIIYFVEKIMEAREKRKSLGRTSREGYRDLVLEKKRLRRLEDMKTFIMSIKEEDFSGLIKDAKNLNLKIIKLCGWLHKNGYNIAAQKSYNLINWQLR